MNPPVNGKIQGLFKVFEYFSSFKANLIFKDFSRQSCIFKYFSNLCQPCIYVKIHHYKRVMKIAGQEVKVKPVLSGHSKIDITKFL